MIDTFTAADLDNMDLRPPKQLVPGVLTAGLNILAGNPKSGKSFLSLGLALALTNGKPAFDKYSTEQTGVLYCALEDNKYRLKARIRTLQQPSNPLLHFTTKLPRLGDGGLQELDAFCGEHPEVGLVVIDTLAKVTDARTGANVYDEDAALGSALHGLAHHHDIALLLVHHTRKAAAGDFMHAVSGSAGLTGTADVVMVLTRKRGEQTAVLEITGRDINESKTNLTWFASRGGWAVVDPPDPYARQKPPPMPVRYHA